MYNNNYSSLESLRNRLKNSQLSTMPGYAVSVSDVNMTTPETTFDNHTNTHQPSTPYCYEVCDLNLKDKEYISSLYPFEARIIKEIVDDELDKLEYEGSIMFHEYPDRAYLQGIIDAIEIILNTDTSSTNAESTQSIPNVDNNISMQQQCSGPNCPPSQFPYPPRFHRPGRQPNWYRSLIETLFFNEMHNRRRRYFGINQNR